MQSKNDWSNPAQDWDRFQSPMLPSPQDIAFIEQCADQLASNQAALSVAVLGLTSQVIACDWPVGTSLSAFDSSPEMIARLWPPKNAPAGAKAHQADWSNLPIADAAIDLFTADGSLQCVDYPEHIDSVLKEIHRCLRPNGRLIARNFIRPKQPESLEAILADLENGTIASPYSLKLRVSAALQGPELKGYSMGAMSQLWRELFPDPQAIAERLGWSLASFAISDAFVKNDLLLTLPTLDELRSFYAPYFKEIEYLHDSYELSENCPTLILEPLPLRA